MTHCAGNVGFCNCVLSAVAAAFPAADLDRALLVAAFELEQQMQIRCLVHTLAVKPATFKDTPAAAIPPLTPPLIAEERRVVPFQTEGSVCLPSG